MLSVEAYGPQVDPQELQETRAGHSLTWFELLLQYIMDKWSEVFELSKFEYFENNVT